MKQISIIAAKGGVGKTAISAAFASIVQDAVLVDCDTESSDLRSLLQAESVKVEDVETSQIVSIAEDECIRCGLCKALCHFDAVVNPYGVYQIKGEHCQACDLCLKACPVSAIDYVQSAQNQWGLAESRFGIMVYAQLALGEDLNGSLINILREKAREIAAEKQKELILIDGPPAMGFAVASAIATADLAVVILEPGLSAIHDLHKSLQLAKRYEVPAVCLINKSDLNPEMTQKIKTYCKDNFIQIIGEIPFSMLFMEAQSQLKSPLELDDSTVVSKSLIYAWEQIQRVIS